jgi:1-deoxy-D-xylulose-5-phosphate synthase
MPEGTGWLICPDIPDRFFDVGIAEQHGYLAAGWPPRLPAVVAIYSTFQRAMTRFCTTFAWELPVILALDRGGLVGEDGPTHHGVFDFSYLRSLPNMV